MKRILVFMFLLCVLLSVGAQKKSIIIPGNGHIDVEKLNRPINLNMDISNLSLSELRVLRNAFAARQGYTFMEADLRALFLQTSWYNKLMMERLDKEERYYEAGYDDREAYGATSVRCTPAELRFIKRLQAREDDLRWNTSYHEKGIITNVDNIVNPYQLEYFDPKLKAALGKNGFAIVPANGNQLFQVYEKNDYSDFPSFVTTDLYLQLFHLYFDALLRDVEENRFDSILISFSRHLYQHFMRQANDKTTPSVLSRHAAWCQAYFGVSLALLTDSLPGDLPREYQAQCADEIAKIMKSENDFSDFLDYHEVYFNYSLFRPRGHYTRSEQLKRYFRAMMWFQTVPFGTDKPHQLQRAVMLAHAIGSTPRALQNYKKLFEPLTSLMGQPDNVTILQVYGVVERIGKPIVQLLKDKKTMAALRTEIEDIARRQTRIKPKFEHTSTYKVNLMPQRYQPDAEVLQEMVDYTTNPTLRDAPKGLDVMAAMGSAVAERILLDELKEDRQWKGYTPMLQKMKTRMGEINWSETLANQWLNALTTMGDTAAIRGVPDFMNTPQWDKKELNAALASWTELKHDAILYAKQPIGAECGGGGIPEPIVRGYVEPNVRFWKKAISLVDFMEHVLAKYSLQTEKAVATTEQMREQAEFLYRMSKKELDGSRLSAEEYKQIEIIGSIFENISLDLVRNTDEWLMGWDDVQGTDKKVALVADVYTANAENNPSDKQSVLYEAIGPVDEIYVVVPINDHLYLTRGAVFSYREFKKAINEPRLTDEEWQQLLQSNPRKGVPEWMKEITVPLDKPVEDNDEIFYSSGC